jgi:uncharacterized protein (DUF952 family)
MAEFTDDDLSGSQLTQVRLSGARFDRVDFSDVRGRSVLFTGAFLHDVDLSGVVLRGVYVDRAEIYGAIESLTVNGVDVAPLVEAELDRRYPDRVKMRPADPAGFREAWDVVERLWAGTVERARRLDPALLHESVDGEWSFIETLRHLAFATDSWLRRAVLGDPRPWDPLDLPWDEMPDTPGVPRDRAVRPSLDTALALRLDRMASVREFVDGLTDATLAADTVPVNGPGWPEERNYPVRQCLRVILNEEWEHRLYAERDLAVLEARAAARSTAPVYKLVGEQEWRVARQAGEFRGSAVDLADGFIHLSTAEQVVQTAARHFADQRGIVLVTVDAARLAEDLRWEPSRGGALFPHLYAALPMTAVVAEQALRDDVPVDAAVASVLAAGV